MLPRWKLPLPTANCGTCGSPAHPPPAKPGSTWRRRWPASAPAICCRSRCASWAAARSSAPPATTTSRRNYRGWPSATPGTPDAGRRATSIPPASACCSHTPSTRCAACPWCSHRSPQPRLATRHRTPRRPPRRRAAQRQAPPRRQPARHGVLFHPRPRMGRCQPLAGTAAGTPGPAVRGRHPIRPEARPASRQTAPVSSPMAPPPASPR